MPIRWDPILVRSTTLELDRALAGASLRGLRLDGETRNLALLFEDCVLHWALHPLAGWMRVSGPTRVTDGDFKLRGRVERVEAPADERWLRVVVTASEGRRLALVVELLGNQWNALLVEGEPEVIRHVLVRREGTRVQRVGERYAPPPPATRAGASGDVSEHEWLDALAGVPANERAHALVRTFAWTSPLNAQALLGEASTSGDPDALRAAFARWKQMVSSDATAPVVLALPGGAQPYPFPLPGTPHRSAASLLAAFDTCARGSGSELPGDSGAGLAPELLSALESALRKAQGRLSRMEDEIASLPDPSLLRSTGDLILARYADIPSGSSRALLVGFDGEPVEVEIDPALPPHANAAAYYTRATKSERASQRLPALAEQARNTRDRLASLLARAREGSADDREVQAVVGSGAPRADAPREVRAALPYRVFRSSGGLEIRVGRGAKHNDELTFRNSSPGDVWMHARHVGGAHVVLRWSGTGNPPARDLAEAATLAAVHSKARTSASVPVDWTFRKYVRKPRKSPPGRVVADRVQTVFVTPDERLVASLAAEQLEDGA